MATEKEIKKELAVALKEVGHIKPRFDKETDCWFFSHKIYPVACEGKTPQAVIKRYPLYLKEFIKHRLNDRLDRSIEARTRGRGGRREGAGRPLGSTKDPKVRMYVPERFAAWLRLAWNMSWVGREENLSKLDRIVHLDRIDGARRHG